MLICVPSDYAFASLLRNLRPEVGEVLLKDETLTRHIVSNHIVTRDARVTQHDLVKCFSKFTSFTT